MSPPDITGALGGCSGRPARRSAARSASSSSTGTSTWRSPGATRNRAVPGMRAHLIGCPACHEDHESLRALEGARP